jgi:aldose 1-epimerase
VPDVELSVGEAFLAVDTAGGGLRALRVGSWEVLDGYPAGTTPHGRRGHVLAPWPNRLAHGRYTWQGTAYRVPVTDAGHDAAIHGFVDQLQWTHTGGYQDETRGEISVGVAMPAQAGYPWPLRVDVQYQLTPPTLEVVVTVSNDGDSAAPLGVGMHPYLNLGGGADATALSLPVSARLPLDDMGAPSGPAVPFDGAIGPVGDRVLDVPLTGLLRDADGWAEVHAGGPAGRITLSVDAAWPWLQVFTADTLPGEERRRSVAVEPNTCPPNAFATGTDVIALHPGRPWRGAWRLTWKSA